MDPKLTEGMRSNLNPNIQIKRERFEEHVQQQQMLDQPPPQNYHQPPPQVSQVDPSLQRRFPNKLFQAHGQVIQHLSRDMVLFESLPDKSWKCLVFLETVMPTHGQRVLDLKAHFPLQSAGMLNATLIDIGKPIQYIANLVWQPTSGIFPNPGMERPITDTHMMKYYDVLGTVGKVLDTVSKMGVNQPDDRRLGFLALTCPDGKCRLYKHIFKYFKFFKKNQSTEVLELKSGALVIKGYHNG